MVVPGRASGIKMIGMTEMGAPIHSMGYQSIRTVGVCTKISGWSQYNICNRGYFFAAPCIQKLFTCWDKYTHTHSHTHTQPFYGSLCVLLRINYLFEIQRRKCALIFAIYQMLYVFMCKIHLTYTYYAATLYIFVAANGESWKSRKRKVKRRD